jgi:uncharacterized protein (TIGR02246 family)
MNMRIAPALILMSLLCSWPAYAQRAKGPAESKSAKSDEQTIRDAVVNFVKQYEAHKPDALASLFAPDARMVYADGSELNGQDEIKQSFAETFESNPKASISVVVDSIKFLTPDVAVEEGTTNVFPDGQTLSSAGRYTVLHVKKNGGWLMQSVRVVKEETISPYEQLQPLEWLVGDWIDEGRDEVVEASFRWDENKAFLLQDFKVIRAGEVVLKGNQRIGWDPQAKQIRSWVFDSSGGFGEVTWTQDGDTWTCKAKGVSAGGDSASATRTLIRDSNDRVFWSSTNRVANGESLDDLTITMVRQPPEPEAAK